MNKNPKFLSLFSGVGGLDLGFIQAGFNPLGAYDICPIAVQNYNQNVAAHAQVLNLAENDVFPSGDPDLVLAGSPCQGFSTIGKRDLNDPRNFLISRAAELAINLDPQVIVLENVPGLLFGEHRVHFKRTERILRKSRYEVQVLQLRADSFGLPQLRKRVFVIASKKLKTLRVNGSKSTPTFRKITEGVSNLANHEPKIFDKNSADYVIANHIPQGCKLCDVRGGSRSVHSWEIPEIFGRTTKKQRELLVMLMQLRRRIRLRPNGDADPVLPSDLRLKLRWDPETEIDNLSQLGYIRQIGERIDLTRTFNGKYKRINAEGKSYSVDTRYGDPKYYLHYSENRGMSVRETARVQGFPDNFIFSGTFADQFRMIGNAVPVPMANALGEGIIRAFK